MSPRHAGVAASAATLFVPALALAQIAGPPPAFNVSEVNFSDDGNSINFAQAYQNPQGNNFPPNPGAIADVPLLAFDSYVAFGDLPASVDNFGAIPPMVPSGFGANDGFFDQPGQLEGFVAGSGNSVEVPFSEFEVFFFARLTVPAGTLVRGQVSFEADGELFTEAIEQFEPDIPGAIGRERGFREFRVVASKTQSQVPLPAGSFSTARGPQGEAELADVFDLYIQQIPTPGAASILGLSGLALLRRRR